MFDQYDQKTKDFGNKNGVLEFISLEDINKLGLINWEKYYAVDKKQAKRFFKNCKDISINEREA